MDYLDYVNDDQRFPPTRQVLADRSDPLQRFDEISFRDHFRMHKVNAVEIISLLEPRLSSVTQRGQPIPVCLQELITLRFLACGTFHRETGDLCGVSETTVCKVIHRVCRAICELKAHYINFPDARTQMEPIFPLSIPLLQMLRNTGTRKNWFSINVQGVCTPQLEFSNIVARWKGATHDSRIFLNSSLYTQFERRDHNGILLGDSGYAQKDFLFTPYLHPTTALQPGSYAHKGLSRCLRKTLRFKPSRCCTVIIATAVLHNYLKKQGCPDPPIEEDDNPDVPPFITNHSEGLAYRDAFALCHFK
uniref:DDE Tnp4 domain-containing protein n=1 Tax=Paramormyrops kingsleyae TaxID=1676925 RepID=A0A3B3QCF9_9TELE